MGSNSVRLEGGPFDGATTSRPVAYWTFLGRAGDGLRGWALPGPRRHLYRLVDGGLVHAQYTHMRCEGCGGFTSRIAKVKPRKVCGLCGDPLVRDAAGR